MVNRFRELSSLAQGHRVVGGTLAIVLSQMPFVPVEEIVSALAGVAQLAGHRPMYQKVAGLSPSGYRLDPPEWACRKQPIDVFHSHIAVSPPSPFPLSLKVNLKISEKREKIVSGEEMSAEESWQPGFIVPAGVGREH